MENQVPQKADNKYSDALDKKYTVSGKLHPTKIDFGANYKHVTMDLRTVKVEVVDDFVKNFPDQPYFKLKDAKATAAAAEVKK